eukprot:1730611-Alexandrium_andersonii.AAC.1
MCIRDRPKEVAQRRGLRDATPFGGARITITCVACTMLMPLGRIRWRCGLAGLPLRHRRAGPVLT